MPNPFDSIASLPRASLLGSPTPIDRLARLSNTLGVDLHIKRDDLTGLGMGGNKIRQLEFYFGAALAQNADTILITGAVQSNYVRSAAAAAAKLGLKAVVQLEERVANMGPAYHANGNVLLNHLLGARVITYPEGENEDGADQALRDEAANLKRQGRTPYVIPLGLNNPPLGALGYMLAAKEIAQQADAFDHIVVASGSGATHAGLLSGLRALGITTPVHGACVRRDATQQRARIQTLSANIATLLGTAPLIGNGDIQVSDSALAPGYGRLGPPAREAIELLARHEGLFVDPAYTAKSLAVAIALVRSGDITQGARVLFVHTGGTPGLFAYEPELRASENHT